MVQGEGTSPQDPMIQGQIETGTPKIDRRQTFLDFIAQPNLQDPANPEGFRFNEISPEFTGLTFQDRIADGTYDHGKSSANVRSNLGGFLDILEQPQGRSFHIVEKARNQWKNMLRANPRLQGRPTTEIVAKLRSILDSGTNSTYSTRPIYEVSQIDLPIQEQDPKLDFISEPEPTPALADPAPELTQAPETNSQEPKRVDRRRLSLLAITQPDPLEPTNPKAYRFKSVWDTDLINLAFPDKKDDPDFHAKKVSSGTTIYTTVSSFLKILENPSIFREDARQKAFQDLELVLKARPALRNLSKAELIQSIRDILSGKLNPKKERVKTPLQEKPKKVRTLEGSSVVLIDNTTENPRKIRKTKPKRPRKNSTGEPNKAQGPSVELQRRERKRLQRLKDEAEAQRKAAELLREVPVIELKAPTRQVTETPPIIESVVVEPNFEGGFLGHLLDRATRPDTTLPFGSGRELKKYKLPAEDMVE